MATDPGIVSGSIDIMAALVIIIGIAIRVTGDFLIVFAVFMVIKALWNYARFPNPLNPTAGLDLLSGLVIALLYFGISTSLFFVVGLFELIKGAFAFVSKMKT